jgi:hypothetical protein
MPPLMSTIGGHEGLFLSGIYTHSFHDYHDYFKHSHFHVDTVSRSIIYRFYSGLSSAYHLNNVPNSLMLPSLALL